jgi:hypothetical protein
VANASTTVTVDLIDEIVVIAGPILAMMIGIDVIIAAIIAAMTGTMTTGVIVVMIAITTDATTDEMIHATTDIAWTTTIARTIIRRNRLHHHRPRGQPRDQLHRRRSPSDQKQQIDPIKHQGDRARQHRKRTTSVLV